MFGSLASSHFVVTSKSVYIALGISSIRDTPQRIFVLIVSPKILIHRVLRVRYARTSHDRKTVP